MVKVKFCPRTKFLWASGGLDLMPGIEANVMTYTAAISSCESAAKWPEAMQLLVNMQESDLLVF